MTAKNALVPIRRKQRLGKVLPDRAIISLIYCKSEQYYSNCTQPIGCKKWPCELDLGQPKPFTATAAYSRFRPYRHFEGLRYRCK